MMTLTEAAARLGVAASTLRWQIRNGKLRAKKVGPVWTVTEREVVRYALQSQRRRFHHSLVVEEVLPNGDFKVRDPNMEST